MGKFSKIFHHIESKDLRNKHEQKKAAKIQEEKKRKEFKQYLVSTMETKKYNWREGMTTSDVSTIDVEKAPGDGTVTAVNTIDASSYVTTVTGVFASGDSFGGNTGTEIRNSGSGSGQDGGFALGQQYLSFQGDGYNDTGHAIRWAGLSAIDSTEVDTLEIDAIVGNDSNGGEDPDAAGEELYLMYKTPAMDQFRFTIQTPDGSFAPGKDGNSTDDVIIPLGASGNSGINKYSVEIPDFARAKGTEFLLIQVVSSGTGFDNYGITKINFQRKAPMSVVVPLDNPEASSFIRSAPPKSTPKKRKKDVDDKLEASDEYTGATFGNDFPGREVRVGGEDPFRSAKIGDDVEPSPQSKADVKKAFSATELKTALGKPTTSQPADPQAKVTGIVKGGEVKSQSTQSQSSLSDFETARKEQQINTQVKQNVNQEIEKSPEVNNLVTKIADELESGGIEGLDNIDPVGKTSVVSQIKSEIADIIIDTIADVTKPILDAETAANTLNSYDDFLGKIKKDPNTPGSSFENPYDLIQDISKKDLAILQAVTTSDEFTSVVNELKVQLGKPNNDLSGNKTIANLGGATTSHGIAKESAQQKLNNLISGAISNSFSLDNTLHNNVQVDLEHLLNTGKVKLTKQYTFKPGGSVAEAEKTWWGQAIENGLGIPLDTMSTGPTAFVGAVAAKVGLGNAKLHGGVYESPGMYTSLEIPTEKVKTPFIDMPSPFLPPPVQAVSVGFQLGKKVVNGLSNLLGFGGEENVQNNQNQSPSNITTKSEFKSKSTPTSTPTTYTVMGVEYDVTTGRPVENLPDRIVNGVHVPAGFPDPPPELINNKDTSNKDEVGSIEFINGEPIYIPPGFDANDLVKIDADGNEIPVNFDGTPKNQFPTDTNLTGQDPIEIPKNLKNIFSTDEMQSAQNLGFSFDEIQQILDNGYEPILNNAIEAEKFGEITGPTNVDWDNEEEVEYYMDKYFQDKGMPQDNTWILMILAAHPKTRVAGGILKIIQSVGKWYNQNKIPGPKGEEGWTWSKLLKDDWLKRQMTSPGKGDWNPFRFLYTWAADKGGMLSGPTPLAREFIRRLGPLGVELLNKITDFGFEEHIKPEIEGYSSEELDEKIIEAMDENPDEAFEVYETILDKNPDYVALKDIQNKQTEIFKKYPDAQSSYDVYKAFEEAAIPYYGVNYETDDGSEWKNTYSNKGYSDSMLGKVDALQKEVDGYTTSYGEYARWAKQQDPNRPGKPINDPDFKEVSVDDHYRKTGSGLTTDLTKSPYLQAEIQWLADNTPGFEYETYAKLNKEMVDMRPYNVEKVNFDLEGLDFFKQMTDPKNPGKFEELYKEVKEKRSRIDDKFVTTDKERYDKAVEAQNTYDESVSRLIKYFEKIMDQESQAGDKMRDYVKKARDARKAEKEKMQKNADAELDKAKAFYDKNVKPIWDDYSSLFDSDKELDELYGKIDFDALYDNASREYLLQTEKERIKNNWNNEDEEENIDLSIEPVSPDPFVNELKAGLGAKPGDELAMAGANYDMYNWILKTYGMPAAEWYLKTGKTDGNPFAPYGSYFPRASNPDADFGTVASVGGIDSATTAATAAAATGKKGEKKRRKNNLPMTAHFKPRGKTLFERVSKLRKPNEFFNPDDIKPEFPENPPPKLDPKTGKHPEYGKKAARYKKLDPISANSMPPTGDPEIDAVVNKQKTINKIKKMARNK